MIREGDATLMTHRLRGLGAHWPNRSARTASGQSAAARLRQFGARFIGAGPIRSGVGRDGLLDTKPLGKVRPRTPRRNDIGPHALLQADRLEARTMLDGTVVAEASTDWATFGGSTEISTSAVTTLYSDSQIAIREGEVYELSGSAISGEDGQFAAGRRQYLGLQSFDAAGRSISPYNYNHNPGSAQTTLAAALTANSTSIELTDATGWENPPSNTPITFWKAALAWWGPGNEYDAYTYSPDRMVGTASTPLWTHVDGNSLRLPQGKTIGDILGANF